VRTKFDIYVFIITITLFRDCKATVLLPQSQAILAGLLPQLQVVLVRLLPQSQVVLTGLFPLSQAVLAGLLPQ
jgi:hypothetical protein